MITTRRMRRVAELWGYNPEETRGAEPQQATILETLSELVYWLGMGAQMICLEPTRIVLRAWVVGETHLISFEGNGAEMESLLKAVFAFGSDKLSDLDVFPELLDGKILMEIVGLSFVLEREHLLCVMAPRQKFAFMAGVGIGKFSDIRFGLGLPLEELQAVVELSRETGLSLREVVERTTPEQKEGGEMKQVTRKRPSCGWWRMVRDILKRR